MKKVRCVVAGETGNGPDLCFVKVVCTDEQYEDGLHYEAAKVFASDQGYDEPMVAFDEHDPPKAMFDLFVWETASVIPTPYEGE